ncbi:hypothetical protein ACXR2U_13645 [Jatrophihabitans sp. YIM 134969]
MVVSERELLALPEAERQHLAAVLLQAGCPTEIAAADRRRRRRFLALTGVAVVVLAVWIVGLGTTLPQTETVGQWRLVWVGFDIGLLVAFATCGWAAWRGRQLLIPATLVTGTLLFCDAWFDTVLSWNTDERWWSVVSAALVEVPLAIWFWWLSGRLVKRTVAIARARLALTAEVPPLREMRLFDPMLVGPVQTSVR